MADRKFKVGDIVKLKSGGPNMTVDAFVHPGVYRCKWFAGASNKMSDYAPDALVLVASDPA